MNVPIDDVQIIRDATGSPEYAVLPYQSYEKLVGRPEASYIPHSVVGKMVDGASAARAWREHIGLTQAELASRMGISQAAYSQLEASEKLRPSSRRKIAEALGLAPEQIV
jgi:DNA-binding XRE family transcriptional regulator